MSDVHFSTVIYQLLALRPLGEAIELVVELQLAAERAELDLQEQRALAKNGDEFSATDFARFHWQHSLGKTLIGLYSGLRVLACHESARRGVAGRSLVDQALVKRLAPLAEAAALVESLQQKSKLAAPQWSHGDDETVKTLGLPSGALLLNGTGF